jgi:dipeptidyl aminopeptidase/acylaminoacyl peptidase
MSQTKKTPRALEPESLYHLQFASDPQISSDGSMVAFVVTSIQDESLKAEKPKKVYRSSIGLSKEGSEAEQFTSGLYCDTSPRFSPDGTSLAFLSNRANPEKLENMQLYLVELGGGEAEQLTMLKSGVSSPKFSPDGNKIAFISRGDWEDKRAEEGTARAFEEIPYKADGMPNPGFAIDEPNQLWVYNLETNEQKAITKIQTKIEGFDWANNTSLVFVAPKNKAQLARWSGELFLVKLEGKKPSLVQLTNWDASMSSPVVSPDGKLVALLASNTMHKQPGDPHLHICKLAKGAMLERIDQKLEFYAGNAVGGDSHYGAYPTGAVWLDNNSLLCGYTFGGSGGIAKVSAKVSVKGKTEIVHLEPETNINSFAAASGNIAFIRESHDELGEVYLETSEEIKQLTNISANALPTTLSSGLEYIKLERDGFVVEGWILKPVGFSSRKKYPVILSVHGGPATAYGHGYYHEFQLLASQGYAVLYGNIRGSVGYGETQTAGTNGRYGAGDYDDLMALFDTALEQFSWLDGTRAAVIGGSYGGFMTNWVISHTRRFKAAITDRCICNFLSFYGTSDIGYRFTPRELRGVVPDDLEHLWEISPLKHVKNVKTPCLIIHSEADHRCPIEQGEQWFTALKRLNVPTRFVRFPDEGHELSRSGRPDRRVRRLTEMLEWFEKYL